MRTLAVGLAAAAAIVHLAVLAGLFAARFRYPFDIEWFEGGLLTHALRVRQGLPLYVPPSAEFVPFPYAPLQPWLVAALSWLLRVPVGYTLGRALSVVASWAMCWAIYRAVRHEGGERWEALCAVGVLAAGFAFTGAWLDLVRIDTVFLALVIGGFTVLRAGGGRAGGVVLGAALLALSFFAKQLGSVFIAAGAVALCLVRWRALALYLTVSGGLVGTGYGLLQWRSGGWFRRWTIEEVAGHVFEHDVLYRRVWERLLDQFWPLGLLVAGAALIAVRRREWRGLGYWGVFAAAAAAATALHASIRQAYINAYLPALVGAAVLAGVAAALWRRAGSPVLAVVAPLLLLVQLVHSAYDPRPFLPGENRARAERFLAFLRGIPGEVLVPYHPFAPVQVGKAPSFHVMASWAGRYGGIGPPADLARAIGEQRYDAIVLDRPPDRSYWETYKLASFLDEARSPVSLTGYVVRPLYVLVPRRPEPPANGQRPLVDFENGSWEGWELKGDAFGPAPNGGPGRFQLPVGPYRGRFFADSGNPTRNSTGTALSPEFEIPASPLRLLVGGGSSPATAARLLVAGRVVREARGGGDDELRVVEWDVLPFVGARARLELVDADAHGYLLADDLSAALR